MRKKTFFFPILLLLTLRAGAQTPVTQADDAYHFRYWQGSPQNANYTEWWYFNLYDTTNDLQAIFSYQVIDPLNLSGHALATVAAVAYQGSQIVKGNGAYPLSSFSASYSAANVTVGTNSVSVTGPNSYLITGASPNGKMTWSLYYDRAAEPWFGGNRVNVATPSWELMSWLIYMPRANVTGTLTINGTAYNVQCAGYHDHNWGQWDFSTVNWNWAQYSQPGLSFDLGDFVGSPNGRASVQVEGRRIVYPASQYQLVHTKWAYDSTTKLFYPTQSVFTADNGTEQVAITMDVNKNLALVAGPAPSLAIFEQPAHFSGVLRIYGEPTPAIIPFAGDGFKEYTATTKAN